MWDLTSALGDWGMSVSEGITALADNITDFVADLASAFDAGGEGDEEHHEG